MTHGSPYEVVPSINALHPDLNPRNQGNGITKDTPAHNLPSADFNAGKITTFEDKSKTTITVESSQALTTSEINMEARKSNNVS